MKINPFSPLVIFAVILGFALIRDFNFKELSFEKPWLDALYGVVFLVLLFLLFKGKSK